MDTRITAHQAKKIAHTQDEVPDLKIKKPLLQEIAEFGLFVAWLCLVVPLFGLFLVFFWAVITSIGR